MHVFAGVVLMGLLFVGSCVAPMQIHIDGASCTARTHFTIPYVKWGMKDPSTLFLRVSKDVDMDITLVGQLSPTPTH